MLPANGYIAALEYAPGTAALHLISPSGAVSTLAGGNPHGYADGAGSSARFANPFGVAVDASGVARDHGRCQSLQTEFVKHCTMPLSCELIVAYSSSRSGRENVEVRESVGAGGGPAGASPSRWLGLRESARASSEKSMFVAEVRNALQTSVTSGQSCDAAPAPGAAMMPSQLKSSQDGPLRHLPHLPSS